MTVFTIHGQNTQQHTNTSILFFLSLALSLYLFVSIIVCPYYVRQCFSSSLSNRHANWNKKKRAAECTRKLTCCWNEHDISYLIHRIKSIDSDLRLTSNLFLRNSITWTILSVEISFSSISWKFHVRKKKPIRIFHISYETNVMQQYAKREFS